MGILQACFQGAMCSHVLRKDFHAAVVQAKTPNLRRTLTRVQEDNNTYLFLRLNNGLVTKQEATSPLSSPPLPLAACRLRAARYGSQMPRAPPVSVSAGLARRPSHFPERGRAPLPQIPEKQVRDAPPHEPTFAPLRGDDPADRRGRARLGAGPTPRAPRAVGATVENR